MTKSHASSSQPCDQPVVRGPLQISGRFAQLRLLAHSEIRIILYGTCSLLFIKQPFLKKRHDIHPVECKEHRHASEWTCLDDDKTANQDLRVAHTSTRPSPLLRRVSYTKSDVAWEGVGFTLPERGWIEPFLETPVPERAQAFNGAGGGLVRDLY